MDEYIPYFITYLAFGGFFFILQSIQIFIINRGLKKNHEIVPTLEQSLFILNDILEEHREKSLSKKLNQLKRKYETNPDKRENSIHLYTTDVNNLIRSSIKEIMLQISDETKTVLLKYYSNDGLIRYVENKLISSTSLIS